MGDRSLHRRVLHLAECIPAERVHRLPQRPQFPNVGVIPAARGGLRGGMLAVAVMDSIPAVRGDQPPPGRSGHRPGFITAVRGDP